MPQAAPAVPVPHIAVVSLATTTHALPLQQPAHDVASHLTARSAQADLVGADGSVHVRIDASPHVVRGRIKAVRGRIKARVLSAGPGAIDRRVRLARWGIVLFVAEDRVAADRRDRQRDQGLQSFEKALAEPPLLRTLCFGSNARSSRPFAWHRRFAWRSIEGRAPSFYELP